VVALLNAYSFVAKPDEAAREHEKWCRDWAELLGGIRAENKPAERLTRRWIARVHELNAECLEDMKAVKAHVYNETMAALGLHGEPYQLTGFQRVTKHLLAHTHAFDEQNLRATRHSA
jgi:hypothetical protein